MFIITYDCLYGKLNFPEIIKDLLDAPEILRLREIGLANIKFLSFPSFTGNRYEHALGVCHLADLASSSLELCEKDRIELMIAALYHDVTTPPFAHATEGILKRYFGFDHEKYLYDLISGRSNDTGKYYAQIYLGRMAKIRTVCQSARARRIGIDIDRILSIIFGKEGDPLSSVVNSDIDIDNLDNVVRAANAMGIEGANGSIAEILAESFVFYRQGKIALLGKSANYVKQWERLRKTLYDMILCSVEDYSLQTMLKHALTFLIKKDSKGPSLSAKDWKLTEEQMLNERIKHHAKARHIYKRMRLRELYSCLALVWLEGKDADKKLEEIRPSLEKDFKKILKMQIVINYYKDKRYRQIDRPFVHFGDNYYIPILPTYGSQKEDYLRPAFLVGVFSPKMKKTISNQQREKIFQRLREDLPSSISIFRVKIKQNEYPHLQQLDEIKC